MKKKINKDSVSDKQVFYNRRSCEDLQCFTTKRLFVVLTAVVFGALRFPVHASVEYPAMNLFDLCNKNNMDLGRLDSGPVQVLVIGLSVTETDSIIRNHAVGHNIKIHHAEDAWEAGFLAQQCKPELVFINSNVLGIQKHAVHRSLTNANGIEPMIVVVDKNYHNDMNMPSQNDESREVIRKAVVQLLSA